MARQATKQNTPPPSASPEDIAAADYADNMFSEGHNRTAEIKKSARGYDAAAHRGDEEDTSIYGEASAADALLSDGAETSADGVKKDASRSREGTQASGRDDESGGFLGGTTQEVDALEASGVPVDKNPRMKN